MLNGFKNIYHRVGRYYFANADARKLAKEYYLKMRDIVLQRDVVLLNECIWNYGRKSGEYWAQIRSGLGSLKELEK